jgi:hypothetical protein
MNLNARHTVLIDAAATTATAIVMLATRELLYPYFGLSSSRLIDLTALAFLGYAAIIAGTAMRPAISRATLMTIAGANVAYVMASLIVLAMFWNHLHPVGRSVIAAVAVAVEAFATLQYMAARRRHEQSHAL